MICNDNGTCTMEPINDDFTSPLLAFPTDISPLGAVFYCDGGFRSNAFGEAAGWGVHGYYYDFEERKAGYGLKSCEPTDYGYMGPAIALKDEKGKALRVSRTGKLEEAVRVRILTYVDAYGNVLVDGTNNIGELFALVHALHIANESPVTLKRVQFVLDSEYVLTGTLSYLAKWIKKDWKKADGQPVANISYWEAVARLVAELEAKGVILSWDWVKGHSADIGNKAADILATKGVKAGYNDTHLSSLKLSPVSKYWSETSNAPSIAKEPRFYIRLGEATSSMSGYVYHFGNQGSKDEFLGAPSADKMYCVIRTDEPFTAHESLKEFQKLRGKDSLARIAEVRNDLMCRSSVYNDIDENGHLHLCAAGKGDVYSPEDELLTEVQWPAALTGGVDSRLEWLEHLLEAQVENRLEKENYFCLTDITDLVYSRTTDKKGKTSLKLNKEHRLIPIVKAPSPSGVIDVKPVLIYGRDLPRHQVLNGIVDENPRLLVLTWPDSSASIRYATFLHTDKADGIWCAVYANFVFTFNQTMDEQT